MGKKRKIHAFGNPRTQIEWLKHGRSSTKDPMRIKYKELPAIEKWTYLTMLAKKRLSPAAKEKFSWMRFYFTTGRKNAIYTAEMYNTNRTTIMKWVKRFKEENLKSLEEESRGPKQPRKLELNWEQIKRIKDIRTEKIDLGPKKLQLLYEKRYKEKISPWHIQRVIEIYDLYSIDEKTKIKIQHARKIADKTRIHKMKEAIEESHKQFGYLIHIDTVVIYEDGKKRYIITAIEDYTRVAFARVYSDHSSKAATEFLMRLYLLMSGRLNIIHVDNGSEFQGKFEELCQKLNIQLIYSRPGTPKDNAKLERFNRTIQTEWLMHSTVGLVIVEDANKDLAKWLEFYNFERPHAAIGYKTPLQFMIESSSENDTKYPFPTDT